MKKNPTKAITAAVRNILANSKPVSEWCAGQERAQELRSRLSEVEDELAALQDQHGVEIAGDGENRVVVHSEGRRRTPLPQWRRRREREAEADALAYGEGGGTAAAADPTEKLLELSDQVQVLEAAIERTEQRVEELETAARGHVHPKIKQAYREHVLMPAAERMEKVQETADADRKMREQLEKNGLSKNFLKGVGPLPTWTSKDSSTASRFIRKVGAY